MNILILGTPNAIHPEKWAEQLAKNHDVIFGFFDGDHRVTSLDQLKIPPLVDTRIIGKNLNIKFVRNLLYRWEMNSLIRHRGWRSRALRKFIKDNDIDVIFAHGLGYHSYMAAGNGLVPVVSASYGSEVFQYFSDVVQYAIDNVDAIQCTSPLMHQTILEKNPNANVHEFYWGVDYELFKPGSQVKLRENFNMNDGNPIIFFPRGMSHIYRGDFITETLEEMSRQNIILSTSGMTNEQLVRIKKTNHKIYYHETRLSMKEYANLVGCADIMVSIPISDQIGNGVMEFMAAGVPMILSDLSVYNSIFEIRNIEVADLTSPARLAKQIEEFGIRDWTEIREFAEISFNWEIAIECFEQMCLSVSDGLL